MLKVCWKSWMMETSDNFSAESKAMSVNYFSKSTSLSSLVSKFFKLLSDFSDHFSLYSATFILSISEAYLVPYQTSMTKFFCGSSYSCIKCSARSKKHHLFWIKNFLAVSSYLLMFVSHEKLISKNLISAGGWLLLLWSILVSFFYILLKMNMWNLATSTWYKGYTKSVCLQN